MNVYVCMPSFFSFAIISFNFFSLVFFLSVILYFSHFVLEKLNVGWSGTATWIYSFCSVCLNSVIRRSSNTYAIAHEISHFLLPSLPISWFLALICFILLGRTSRIIFFSLSFCFFTFLCSRFARQSLTFRTNFRTATHFFPFTYLQGFGIHCTVVKMKETIQSIVGSFWVL